MALVSNKEEKESHKICEIARTLKFCEFETYRIMGSIEDLFLEWDMIERLIASINFWGVKFKAMESKTVQSVIMSEEVSHKFNIGIDKS